MIEEEHIQNDIAELPLLPWTRAVFDKIVENPERQAHAYLLAGHAGLGKTAVAEHLARSLLCVDSAAYACGHCQSCRIFNSGSHPDLHVLQSEKLTVSDHNIFSRYALRYLEDESIRKKRKKPSPDIRIDQVRAVIPDVNTRPQMSKCRVIVINQAEDMNVNAANALLKSLEEPPSDTYFLLVSHDPGRLVPTIRSRCNRVDFRVPEKKLAIAWLTSQLPPAANAEALLEGAAGLPLLALAHAQGTEDDEIGKVLHILLQLAVRKVDPASAARELQAITEPVLLYNHIQKIISDIIRQKFSGSSTTATFAIENRGLIDLVNSLNFRQLYAFLDKISETKGLAGGPLDETLALEDNLISWQGLFKAEQGY